jgi:hypothetical protein
MQAYPTGHGFDPARKLVRAELAVDPAPSPRPASHPSPSPAPTPRSRPSPNTTNPNNLTDNISPRTQPGPAGFYDMDAAFMSFELHERGIHVV